MSDPKFIIKSWAVTVYGCTQGSVFAKARGAALADIWRCDAFGHLTFGEFLKVARCRRDTEHAERWGEHITVGGRPAFMVGLNSQYIQFAYEDGDQVFNTHPLDVMPPDARRGTPYYVEGATQ
jgi:hypothetical protein